MKLPALSTAVVLSLALTAADDPTRVLPAGQKPQDARIGKVRTLNDKDFLFTPPADLKTWSAAPGPPRTGPRRRGTLAHAREDAAQRRDPRQDRPR